MGLILHEAVHWSWSHGPLLHYHSRKFALGKTYYKLVIPSKKCMHLPWKLLGRQWEIKLLCIYAQEKLLSSDILSKAQTTPVSPFPRCDRKMKRVLRKRVEVSQAPIKQFIRLKCVRYTQVLNPCARGGCNCSYIFRKKTKPLDKKNMTDLKNAMVTPTLPR